MPTPLEVPRHILEEIYRQARREYPNECCGWLSGDKDSSSVTTVRACINMQAQGNHPIAPGRTAEKAYVFGQNDLKELDSSFYTDTPARIIYHSHPNGRSAYFSEIDKSGAKSPFRIPGEPEQPAYPVQQLVIGIDAHRVVDSALYDWFDAQGDFIEIARFDGADI